MTLYADLLLAVATLILAVALFIHIRQMRRHLSAFKPEETRKRLAEIEQRTDELSRDTEENRKDIEGNTISLRMLQDDIKEMKEEGDRNLTIFKTVLYGFDYIVQGCKHALELGEITRPEEKQVKAPAEEDLHASQEDNDCTGEGDSLPIRTV